MADSSQLPVVVLRSNDICFLGILRSCKAAGIPTIPVIFTWPEAPIWYSQYSNCYSDPRVISNPFTHSALAVTQLKEIFSDLFKVYGTRLMVLPSGDTNLMFLLDHYHEFQDFIKVMGHQDFSTPRSDVINKFECAKLLAKSNPEIVPVTQRCQHHPEIETVVENMVYPAIYKPTVKDYGQTFYRAHNGNKAIECKDQNQLRSCLKAELDNGFDLVVQEKLIFDSVYDEIPFYLYADRNHNITMAGNGIKEVIEPFPFGTAIVLRFAWLQELLELAQSVVSALGYRGILMIEFVKDKKGGGWKVVEINPRHWLFNGFYQRLGLNYTEQLIQDDLGKDSAGKMVVASEETIKADYAHVDLMALAEVWKRDEPDLSMEQYLSRLDAIDGSLSSAFIDLDDPEPGIQRTTKMLEQNQWPTSALDKIVSRLKL